MAEKQQGATLVFGTSAGSWSILSIGRFNAPIPKLDDTHLGTTSRRESIFGVLEDPQPFTVTVQNKGGTAYPVKGLVQTITITSPLGTWTTAEKLIGSGAVIDVKTAEFQSGNEAIQTVEFEIQFDGKTGPARTLAA
jgi:hypothetical protein